MLGRSPKACRPDGGSIRLMFEGEGRWKAIARAMSVELPFGSQSLRQRRLESAGLELREQRARILVDNVIWNSPAQLAKIDFDWEIKDRQACHWTATGEILGCTCRRYCCLE